MIESLGGNLSTRSTLSSSASMPSTKPNQYTTMPGPKRLTYFWYCSSVYCLQHKRGGHTVSRRTERKRHRRRVLSVLPACMRCQQDKADRQTRRAARRNMHASAKTVCALSLCAAAHCLPGKQGKGTQTDRQTLAESMNRLATGRTDRRQNIQADRPTTDRQNTTPLGFRRGSTPIHPAVH
jgi:hypothetical protein